MIFDTEAEAQAVADRLDEQARAYGEAFYHTRLEVIPYVMPLSRGQALEASRVVTGTHRGGCFQDK